MEAPAWAARGLFFGSGAELYDQTRPSYPTDSIRWVLGHEPMTVVDLGAGTGILSRQLVELGYQTIAVEPDDAMRARLAANSPTVTVLGGTAESIPLPDASADAVLAGQAYHWFDPEPSHAEIARVTRPGGVFGSLWNLRDESVAWSAELSMILHDEDTGVDTQTAAAVMLHGALAKILDEDTDDSGWLGNPTFGEGFGVVSWQAFRHTMSYSPDTLADFVRSRCYYRTASVRRRVEIERQVQQLVTNHPELCGRSVFDLPYVALAYRADRLPITSPRANERGG
jgi:SAM-dependent methyltransferase